MKTPARRNFAALIVAVGALALLARSVDWTVAGRYIGRVGHRAPWALVPYFFVLLFDALGWQSTFAHRPPLWRLWRIRAETEAVASSVPAGTALGESLRVFIVNRRIGLPVALASANAVVTKIAIALTQALFVIGSLALTSRGPYRAEWAAVAGCAWVLVALGLQGLAGAKPLGKVVLVLGRVRRAAVRGWLTRWEKVVAEADDGLGSFAGLPLGRRLRSLGWFLLGWVALGAEDWLILSFLTPGVSVEQAMAMEGLISVVRIGFFFVPGALGAQEVGYYEVLSAFGVSDAAAVSAAFSAIKRAREVFWIALGYLALAHSTGRGAFARPLPMATGDALTPSNESQA